jgi:poly-gamma-glutamate biosynthesis protein PgsC/CapC
VSGLAPEVSILGLSLGLVLALICYLVTNLSPGGMITPGWLALVLITDPRLGAVIGVVALATYGLARLAQRVVIVYGKRLFATVVLIGVFIQSTVFVLSRSLAENLDYTTLGFIIPGLVAYQLLRQPVVATLISTSAVASLTYIVILVGVELHLVEAEQGAAGQVAAQSLTGAPALTADPLRLTIAGAVFVVGLLALGRSIRRVERRSGGVGPQDHELV